MTGEISLTGNVLPIGGVKEKIMGALNSQITEVILPMENKPDFDEIEKEIKSKVKANFVEKIEEVLNIILSDERVVQNSVLNNPIFRVNLVNFFPLNI